jgi:tetratricopeptide (TPR) repeat protein
VSALLSHRVRELLARGSRQEARAAVEEALAREPLRLDALLLSAALLLEARDDAGALETCRRAASAWPDSASARNALARCLHALGRPDEALHEAERARLLLERDENFVETAPVYLTLVWCLRDLRRYRDALAAAEEGLLRTPDAVLAECATEVERELALAERERC